MLNSAEINWIVTLICLDNNYLLKSFHHQNIKNKFRLKLSKIMLIKNKTWSKKLNKNKLEQI